MLIIARFLGPQLNQFKHWDGRNEEEEEEETSDEDDAARAKKYRARTEDDEPWTEYHNGEDARNAFTWRRTPGRIIQLGDGSELFTDQQDGEHRVLSSSDDDSGDEHDAKMRVDGITEEGTKGDRPSQSKPLGPPPVEAHESATGVLYRSPSPPDSHP
jgi:hypothetical protein